MTDELAALRFKLAAVRAVLDSPRVGAGRSASLDLGHEPIRVVLVKDVEAALDGHRPAGGPCMVCEQQDTLTTWRDQDGASWWLCTECKQARDAELAAMRRIWDKIPLAEQEIWLREDINHSTVEAFLPHYPGQLTRKYDGGRGAMLNEDRRIVGYYNPPPSGMPRAEELIERVHALMETEVSPYEAMRLVLAEMAQEHE